MPAKRRCIVAVPLPGTELRELAGYVWSAASDVQTKFGRMLGGGKSCMSLMGYGLKCFHTWASMEGVLDWLRCPLCTEVAKRYIYSLVSPPAIKTIRARILLLHVWHNYHLVCWGRARLPGSVGLGSVGRHARGHSPAQTQIMTHDFRTLLHHSEQKSQSAGSRSLERQLER